MSEIGVSEKDKEHFFYETCGLRRHHRNMLSYAIFSVSNIAVLTLAVFKITHPAILIGSCSLNALAHFLKTSTTADKLQDKVMTLGTQLMMKDDVIRRLSITPPSSDKSAETLDFKSAKSE